MTISGLDHVGGWHVLGVDTHTHVLHVDAPLVAPRHSAPSRDAGVEELLGLLDAHGLSHAVVTAPSFYGTENHVLLDALARGHGRLIGTVSVGQDVALSYLQHLARLGVAGIRLNWHTRRPSPDPCTAGHRRLFAAAAQAGLHVQVLVEPAALPLLTRAVLGEGAELVVDHLGLIDDVAGPAGRALMAALDNGHTWVKLSAPYRLHNRRLADEVARALLAVRPDRVLWGSDWPWVSHENDGFDYADTLRWLDDWVADPDVRHAVLVGNPAELLGLPRPAVAASQQGRSA